MSKTVTLDPTTESAITEIEAFGDKYGESHLYLAYHAAFSLAFTPTLIYNVRQQFGKDIHGKSLGIPWIAVADLLLSDLCYEVDEDTELYEMDIEVRRVLLHRLKSDPILGQKRLEELSKFLSKTVQRKRRSPEIGTEDITQLHNLIALAYTQPTKVKAMLSKELQKSDFPNLDNVIRISSIIEALTDPLEKANISVFDLYDQGLKELQKNQPNNHELEETWLTPFSSSDESNSDESNTPQYFQFEVVTIDRTGKRLHRPRTYKALYFTENCHDLELEMVAIPGGTLTIKTGRTSKVVNIEPFFINKYPITQAQWSAVAELTKVERDLKLSPSYFKGENLPVEQVSWCDAVEFCARLSRHTGEEYRLPSEAEWEYACRAGTKTPFHFGETITSELANYNTEKPMRGKQGYADEDIGAYRKATTPINEFPYANRFGLYDMHGNVREWCADDWHDNYKDIPKDGSPWRNKKVNISDHQDSKVVRGGSWVNHSKYCESIKRQKLSAGRANNSTGFRVALSPFKKPDNS